MSPFFIPHDVQVVAGGEVRGGRVAAGSGSGRTPGHTVRGDLPVLEGRHAERGQREVRGQVLLHRSRFRDIDYFVLPHAHEHHHDTLHPHWDQAEEQQGQQPEKCHTHAR